MHILQNKIYALQLSAKEKNKSEVHTRPRFPKEFQLTILLVINIVSKPQCCYSVLKLILDLTISEFQIFLATVHILFLAKNKHPLTHF